MIASRRAGTLLGCSVLVLLACAAPLRAAPGGAGEDPVIRVTVAARAVQPGEAVRLDVVCACGDGTPRASVFDRIVPLVPAENGAGWHGLVGIDLDVTPGSYPITIVVNDAGGGRRESVTPLVVAAKAFPTRRLQVAAAYVEPPAAEVERLLRDARVLDGLFHLSTLEPWRGAFVAPVAARATSNFGARSVFNGQARSPHGGIDFGSPTGTPVGAPAAGRIVLAEDLFFTGNTVVIDHGLGVVSLYAHLSAIGVSVGDVVERGAVLGRVGATGRVTGPHLHWAVRVGGARVDPLSLIEVTKAPAGERRQAALTSGTRRTSPGESAR